MPNDVEEMCPYLAEDSETKPSARISKTAVEKDLGLLGLHITDFDLHDKKDLIDYDFWGIWGTRGVFGFTSISSIALEARKQGHGVYGLKKEKANKQLTDKLEQTKVRYRFGRWIKASSAPSENMVSNGTTSAVHFKFAPAPLYADDATELGLPQEKKTSGHIPEANFFKVIFNSSNSNPYKSFGFTTIDEYTSPTGAVVESYKLDDEELRNVIEVLKLEQTSRWFGEWIPEGGFCGVTENLRDLVFYPDIAEKS